MKEQTVVDDDDDDDDSNKVAYFCMCIMRPIDINIIMGSTQQRRLHQ